jgi:hypothetical protein
MFAMIVAAQPTTSLLSLSAMCSTKLCIATEKYVETEHVKHSGLVGGEGGGGRRFRSRLLGRNFAWSNEIFATSARLNWAKQTY